MIYVLLTVEFGLQFLFKFNKQILNTILTGFIRIINQGQIIKCRGGRKLIYDISSPLGGLCGTDGGLGGAPGTFGGAGGALGGAGGEGGVLGGTDDDSNAAGKSVGSTWSVTFPSLVSSPPQYSHTFASGFSLIIRQSLHNREPFAADTGRKHIVFLSYLRNMLIIKIMFPASEDHSSKVNGGTAIF